MATASMLSSSLLPVICPEAASPTILMSWNTCSGEAGDPKCPGGGGAVREGNVKNSLPWPVADCTTYSDVPVTPVTPNTHLP